MKPPVLAAIIAALALSIPAVALIAYEYGRAHGPERIIIEATDQPVRVWP